MSRWYATWEGIALFLGTGVGIVLIRNWIAKRRRLKAKQQTFLDLYNAVPELAKVGRARIQGGIDFIESVRERATEEDARKADEAIKAALTRLDYIEKATHRVQGSIHQLALMCHDSSIPMPSDGERV